MFDLISDLMAVWEKKEYYYYYYYYTYKWSLIALSKVA